MPGTFMVMATRKGEIKKTAVDKFTSVRSSGLIAMDLAPGDELVAVCLATDKDDVHPGDAEGAVHPLWRLQPEGQLPDQRRRARHAPGRRR